MSDRSILGLFSQNDNGERGQVGIGTLIVFIALVLVAAIAAGVLINTAGFLQSQAESTGQESTSQVSDNVEVLSTIGQLNDASPPDAVGTLKITLSKGAGSGNVDLEALTIEYVGPGGSNTLTASTNDMSSGTLASDSTAADYGIETVSSSTSSDDALLSEDKDQYTIVIGLGADDSDGTDADSGGNLNDLSGGDEATLTITTAQGSQRTVDVSVPTTLGGNDNTDEIRV